MASSTGGCLSYGKIFINLMSCDRPSKLHTDASLKQELFVVIGAGVIFTALFVIGIVSKMGWLSTVGGIGLLLTAYAGYNHWQGVKLLESQGGFSDGFYWRRLIDIKNFVTCAPSR